MAAAPVKDLMATQPSRSCLQSGLYCHVHHGGEDGGHATAGGPEAAEKLPDAGVTGPQEVPAALHRVLGTLTRGAQVSYL